MKKFIVFAVVLTLLVPSLALAAAEFSLGGFIKLDSFWDSTQEGKNMNTAISRSSQPTFNHGRTKFTAQGSRFNLTIKGPDLWGAKTTGFLEMDFDAAEVGAATTAGVGIANNASQGYTPRLRHAMFRFNWPETELLFGQYWSMFCEWYPELAEDGPFQGTGAPTARIPQIRFTQQFLGWGTAAILVGEANGASLGQTYSGVDNSGESTAAPQVQAKLQYQQDLWGKAAYYGTPTPFTAKLTAGWQRTTSAQNSALAVETFGPGTFSNPFNISVGHSTLDPWLAMFSMFVPVIPTHSANLAGTASILTQWWIGAGVDVFGISGGGNYFRFNNNRRNILSYDYTLQERFGGEVQAQYYFTNQWFLTVAYGLSKSIGLSQSDTSKFASRGTAGALLNQPGYTTAFTGDTLKTWQQAEAILWYRPIQAIKFGLEYAYGYTAWFQSTGSLGAGATSPFTTVAAPINAANVGNAHRVEFVGFFYF